MYAVVDRRRSKGVKKRQHVWEVTLLKHFLPFLAIIILVACAPDLTSPEIQTAVIQSLTATVWTPTPVTPTATPEPNTSRIVDVLNNAMIGSDPLAETVDAKFTVIDARVMLDDTTKQSTTLRIHVECEWVFTDSCTPEQTFVALIRALTVNNKLVTKIAPQIPSTVSTLQMVAFDRMVQTGTVIVAWNDLMDYATGRINGNQLGSRITRQVAGQ
jgi:hypothetical protein